MPSSLPSFIISTGLIFFDLPWSGTVCAFCLYLYYYQQQVGGFISTANCSTVQMDAIPFGATKIVCFKICHGNIITHLTSHPDIVPLLHLWKALIWDNAKAKTKKDISNLRPIQKFAELVFKKCWEIQKDNSSD